MINFHFVLSNTKPRFSYIKTQLNCGRVKETVKIDRPGDEEPGRTTVLLGGHG